MSALDQAVAALCVAMRRLGMAVEAQNIESDPTSKRLLAAAVQLGGWAHDLRRQPVAIDRDAELSMAHEIDTVAMAARWVECATVVAHGRVEHADGERIARRALGILRQPQPNAYAHVDRLGCLAVLTAIDEHVFTAEVSLQLGQDITERQSEDISKSLAELSPSTAKWLLARAGIPASRDAFVDVLRAREASLRATALPAAPDDLLKHALAVVDGASMATPIERLVKALLAELAWSRLCWRLLGRDHQGARWHREHPGGQQAGVPHMASLPPSMLIQLERDVRAALEGASVDGPLAYYVREACAPDAPTDRGDLDKLRADVSDNRAGPMTHAAQWAGLPEHAHIPLKPQRTHWCKRCEADANTWALPRVRAGLGHTCGKLPAACGATGPSEDMPCERVADTCKDRGAHWCDGSSWPVSLEKWLGPQEDAPVKVIAAEWRLLARAIEAPDGKIRLRLDMDRLHALPLAAANLGTIRGTERRQHFVINDAGRARFALGRVAKAPSKRSR